MPKSLLDWLAVVMVWIGGIVLAFKSAGAPLANGAPTILASNVWNFVPGFFVTVAVLIFIYRLFVPASPKTAQAVPPKAIPSAETSLALPVRVTQRASILYDAKAAVRSARSAMADNPSNRTAEKQLPSIKAIVLTLMKNFAVNFPRPTGKPNIDLEGYLRVIEEMLPYLLQGHDEAARDVGESWIKSLDIPE